MKIKFHKLLRYQQVYIMRKILMHTVSVIAVKGSEDYTSVFNELGVGPSVTYWAPGKAKLSNVPSPNVSADDTTYYG